MAMVNVVMTAAAYRLRLITCYIYHMNQVNSCNGRCHEDSTINTDIGSTITITNLLTYL